MFFILITPTYKFEEKTDRSSTVYIILTTNCNMVYFGFIFHVYYRLKYLQFTYESYIDFMRVLIHHR